MRQKTGYLSIMILSGTDLIVVTTIPAVFLVNTIPELLGTTRCLYTLFYNVVISTTHPFFHHSTVTKGKIIWSFGILGSIFLICAAIIFVWHSIGKLIAFIICSTTVFQYVSIFRRCKKSIYTFTPNNRCQLTKKCHPVVSDNFYAT